MRRYMATGEIIPPGEAIRPCPIQEAQFQRVMQAHYDRQSTLLGYIMEMGAALASGDDDQMDATLASILAREEALENPE